jgi:hypothetical protein
MVFGRPSSAQKRDQSFLSSSLESSQCQTYVPPFGLGAECLVFSAVDTELKLKRQTQLGVQFGKFPIKRPVLRSPWQVQ